MGKVLYMRKGELHTAPVVYEQLVNYTMLYDSGDECTALTGGWERYGYNSGVFEKNADHIYATGVGNAKNTNGFGTVNSVSVNGHSKLCMIIKADYEDVDTGRNAYSTCWSAGTGSGKFDGDYENVVQYLIEDANDGTGTEYCVVRNHNNSWLNMKKLVVSDLSSLTSFYPTAIYQNWWKVGTWPLTVYSAFMTEADDWQTLANKAGITASSISDIITNAETLLSNKGAIQFMVAQCTGDFMVAALQSETFLAALEASPNKSLVYANEHWSKFLALLGVN